MRAPLRDLSNPGTNIRAFIIGIGFWNSLYYSYNKELPK